MRPQVRDRLVLPILLPLGIVLVIGGALFGFSRILLGVSHTAATTTALVVAVGIVVVASIAATRAHVRGSTIAAMVGGVTGVAMLSGGVALAVLGGEEGGEEAGGAGAVVTLAAVDLAFEPSSLGVPAGEPFTIAFDNQDAGTQHNVDIFASDDFSGEPIFNGDLIAGVAQVDYQVPALEPGTYAFRCVVHPQMTGTIEATEGGGGEGPGAGVTVSAANVAFDTDRIDLPPDAPSTITFDNRDPGVQHNISIYADETLGEVLFEGDIITGPDSIEYAIPPLPAGEYYFHCDVHPTMNGTVAVGGAPPPGEGEPGGGVTGTTGGPGPTGETGGGSTGSTGATGPTGTGAGGGGDVVPSTVVANQLAFDTDEISIPAGAAATLTFDNDDAGAPHNVAIYEDASLAAELFRGDIITGPDTIDYSIPALEAGEYYFQCDVHPTMNGAVVVS